MGEEFLHSPWLPDSPTWIAPDTLVCEVCSSIEECSIFSDSDVIDLPTSLPPPKKRRTDYFQPTKGKSERGMPYFLQQYNPRPAVVSPNSSFNDRTAGELPSPNDPSGLGSSASNPKSKGKSKHSAVNKTYTLAQKMAVLKYAGTHSESEAARHFGIPRTTIRGWKGLDQQPRNKISQARKGKNKAGAGRPLYYGEDLDMDFSGSLKCMICICQSKESTYRGNHPNPTNTSYFQSICWVVCQIFD